MRALCDAKCSVWQSAHLRHHAEKETDCSFKCSFTSESGTQRQLGSTTRRALAESTWFFRPRAASGDCKRMPLVSFNFLHTTGTLNITRVRHFCTVFAAQAEAMYRPKSSSHSCLLSVRCVKLRKSRIKNQSPRLFHKLNPVCCSFSSVSYYYDHIIRCHLSLPGIPRARFARVAQFRCANVVPTARPFAGADWRNMFFDEDQKEEKRKGGTYAARRVSLRRGADAWERIWRSDDGNGLSKYRRWSKWLRENTEESISRLTDTSSRTYGTSERHRDELLQQCAQSRRLLEGFLCQTSLVEGVASFQPFAAAEAQRKAYSEAARGQKGHQMGDPFMSMFAAFVNGLVTENPGVTELAEIEVEWLNQFRKQLISASDGGRFLEMWNIRKTHPKGGPVRTLVRYRMRTPGPALPEDAQNINKLAQILRKVLLHRKVIGQEGRAPPTNNERKIQSQLEHRRKRVEGKYT